MSEIRERYLSDDYIEKNPTWDMQDSVWKAERAIDILERGGVVPRNICEVGCGAGKILEVMAAHFPEAEVTGYDIAPAASTFWKDIDSSRIKLKVGDFFEIDRQHHHVVLLLDVLEHVADPHAFLAGVRERSDFLVVHFPLDLSAMSVLRESPLLHVRRKVGHIHYFTKGLALELIAECDFEIIEWRYTGAAFNTPQSGLKTRLAQWPRRLAYAMNKEWGVRLLGGETLMVLARPK